MNGVAFWGKSFAKLSLENKVGILLIYLIISFWSLAPSLKLGFKFWSVTIPAIWLIGSRCLVKPWATVEYAPPKTSRSGLGLPWVNSLAKYNKDWLA